MLVKSDVPLSDEGLLGMTTHEYGKRYPNHIFRLKRGQTQWVEPLFAHESFKGLWQPTLSRDGDLVFDAAPPKMGSISICRHKTSDGFLKWSTGQGQDSIWVVFSTARLMYSALIDSKLIGIFSNYVSQNNQRLRRFLTLDMESGVWRAMSIPPVSTAKAIPVTLK